VGAFISSYNRFSVPIDFMWMRLKDSKAIPFAPAYSVQALLNFSIATPKVAYLLVNSPKIEIYATAGPRIWHQGTTLNLTPTIAGRNFYAGTTWTDFVAGGRFSVPLGSKASVNVLGDAGEGGATLDYQVAGFVNYQFSPKWTLQGGWRYLTVKYGNNGNLINATIQGIVLGATYKFKWVLTADRLPLWYLGSNCDDMQGANARLGHTHTPGKDFLSDCHTATWAMQS
jgi:hypothetical protein